MQKICVSLLFISLLFSQATGQHFIFDPQGYHEETVSAFEYSNHIIYMENLTGGELVLAWERLGMVLPEGWGADLCDYVGCYTGIPESGTMLGISDTTRAYLKVTVNPSGTPGTGTLVFKVYDNKHPEYSDTCTFVIHATATTRVETTEAGNSLQVYPVPAREHINIKTAWATYGATIKIFNVQGQLVHEQQIDQKYNTKISIRHLPGGVYLVQLSDEQGNTERKKLLIE